MAREIGRQQRLGLRPLLASSIDQDAKEATAYILYLQQAGLGLPDRDYYLADDPKMEANRQAYRVYLQKMLELAGNKQAKSQAEKIWALELELARAHWTRAETRDREKAYNKYPAAELGKLAPAFDWPALFEGLGTAGSGAVIVRQPSFVQAMSAVMEKTPLATWKIYLEWRLLDGYAPLLSEPFVTTHFAFHGATLSGIQTNEERWKRGARRHGRGAGGGGRPALRRETFPARGQGPDAGAGG